MEKKPLIFLVLLTLLLSSCSKKGELSWITKEKKRYTVFNIPKILLQIAYGTNKNMEGKPVSISYNGYVYGSDAPFFSRKKLRSMNITPKTPEEAALSYFSLLDLTEEMMVKSYLPNKRGQILKEISSNPLALQGYFKGKDFTEIRIMGRAQVAKSDRTALVFTQFKKGSSYIFWPLCLVKNRNNWFLGCEPQDEDVRKLYPLVVRFITEGRLF